MPLRGGLMGEFFKAWGNLSIRCGKKRPGAAVVPTPGAHRRR
jgi:hypothetical protein